jgi:23S rRNA pseudouridine2457 synthase
MNLTGLKYYIIYKPYGMLSQFSREGDKPTLANLAAFDKDIYPIGRLDADSEGLLILTNDKELNHRLLNPKFKHNRTYLSQVEGIISKEAILNLSRGVTITVDGKTYRTLPAKAKVPGNDPFVPERVPPIRFRKNIPTSWIELTLCEGKNRQVRKMTAVVGLPTLRLIRVAIEGIKLGNMLPGDVKEVEKDNVYKLLFSKG